MSIQSSPPAEAELIRHRREAATPAMSRRQAATKAGISPSQWSDVERGSKQGGSGVTIPVYATAQTLARMARAVGATPEDLRGAGREDAASVLLTLEQERELRRRLTAIPGFGDIGTEPVTGTDGQELLPLIAESLDAIERSKLPASAQHDLTAMFIDNLIHDAARRHAELRLILRLAENTSQSG